MPPIWIVNRVLLLNTSYNIHTTDHINTNTNVNANNVIDIAYVYLQLHLAPVNSALMQLPVPNLLE